MTTVSSLPSAPNRNDSSTFSTKADAWVAALGTWTTEVNTVAGEINTNASTASSAASTASTKAAEASASAAAAANSAGATLWVSGSTYQAGQSAIDPVDFYTYRRTSTGSGTTRPGLDTGNWVNISGNVSTTGTQTLTNKTIEAGVFTNGYTEETYAPSAGSAFTFDFANGTIQSYTTNANTTITLPAVVAGKSFQIHVNYGGAHTLGFAGGAVAWPDNTTPSFSATSGKTDIVNFVANAAGTKWMGSLYGKGYTT